MQSTGEKDALAQLLHLVFQLFVASDSSLGAAKESLHHRQQRLRFMQGKRPAQTLISSMRSSATRAHCFTSSSTLMRLTTLPSTRFSSDHARCCGEIRYIVVHRHPESSSVTTCLPSGAKCFASRLTRWISVPTAKLEPSGAFSTTSIMRSVEPIASAFWQTSQ